MTSMLVAIVLLGSVLPQLSLAHQKVISSNENVFTSHFNKLVYDSLDHWHVPGLALGVVDGDRVWTRGYGIAAFPSTQVTTRTNFYAGSTSKAFTAAALSLLIDNSSSYSSITWATPIASIIRDDFVLEDDWVTSHTTIEDALSHRTGMPRHDLSYGGTYANEKGDGYHKGTIKDAVRSLRWLPSTAELRTTFQYCNLMYVVASHVVETLTSTWLGDVLNERIWMPLGMDGTYFSTSDALLGPEPLAQGYAYYNGTYQPVPYMDLDMISGAGSVISNVEDYVKWLRCLLSSSAPLSPDGHAALRTSRSFMPSDSNSPFTGTGSYCLGWWTGVYRGYEYFEHSGGMEAFGTQIIYFPKLDFGLVTFGNTATTSNYAGLKIIWHLVDEKIETPEEDRFDWDRKHEAQQENATANYDNAPQRLYPYAPDPPMPHSLPLESYAGTYFHPGYRNFTLYLRNGKLHCDRNDVSWKLFFDLEHVTGDFFVAYIDSYTAPGMVFKQAIAAEFAIGSNGAPQKFGLDAGPDTRPVMIWFDRVS